MLAATDAAARPRYLSSRALLASVPMIYFRSHSSDRMADWTSVFIDVSKIDFAFHFRLGCGISF